MFADKCRHAESCGLNFKMLSNLLILKKLIFTLDRMSVDCYYCGRYLTDFTLLHTTVHDVFNGLGRIKKGRVRWKGVRCYCTLLNALCNTLRGIERFTKVYIRFRQTFNNPELCTFPGCHTPRRNRLVLAPLPSVHVYHRSR